MAAPGKPRKRLGAFGGIGDAVAGEPLVARVVAAVGVLAVLIALAFAIVLFALGDLRQSTREQVAAKEVATATLRLERLVDELEQSLRGYVLTRNAGILGVWDQASAQVPDATKQLEQLVAAQPGEAPLAANLDSMITSYVDDYGVPLIAIAKLSPSAALSSVASREGLTRIGDIRRRLSRLLSAEDTIVSAHAASANSSANRAIVIGSVALGASAVVLLLVSAFLVRAVARPVRTVAAGATRIAGGDLTTRIEAGGPAEIRDLTNAFNAMANSLEQSRRNLEVQNEQLRQSERAKSELITIVSHEIRTPLASILGYSSLMLRRELDPEELRRYTEVIHEQGQRLQRLVEGFLGADASERALDLRRERFDLAQLVREETRLVAAESTDHELSIELPETLPVVADRDRIAQVVENLLTNAIKYSPAGGRVSVAALSDGELVQVQVRDRGLGIPQEHQPRVFSKFFRGAAQESGISGVGLGLALSREIVEAHGGRIGFWSVEGEGSTFWFELPIDGDGAHP